MECKVIELPHIMGVAIDVLCGAFGDGPDRIRALEAQGYDAQRIQACVNDILKLVEKYQEG